MQTLKELLLCDIRSYRKGGEFGVPTRGVILAMMSAINASDVDNQIIFIQAPGRQEAQDKIIYQKLSPYFGQEKEVFALVELGARKHWTTHYFAAKFEFSLDGSCSFFVLDYIDSKGIRLRGFQSIAALHGYQHVYRYCSFGRKLQSDNFSCGFFAFDALQQLKKIPLVSLAELSDEDGTIPWKRLPSVLIHNAQSMKAIWEYVDCRAKFFQPGRSEALEGSVGFEQYISKGCRVVKAAKDDKIVNDSITAHVIKKLADQTDLFLCEQQFTLDFIDHIYPETVCPHIYQYFNYFLNRGIVDTHPIVSAIYHNEDLWESLLANEDFFTIFSDEGLLEIVQCEIISFNLIFDRCVLDGIIEKDTINILKQNLGEPTQFLLDLAATAGRSLGEPCQNLTFLTRTASIGHTLRILGDRASSLVHSGKLTVEDLAFINPFSLCEDDLRPETSDAELARKLLSYAHSPSSPYNSNAFFDSTDDDISNIFDDSDGLDFYAWT